MRLCPQHFVFSSVTVDCDKYSLLVVDAHKFSLLHISDFNLFSYYRINLNL